MNSILASEAVQRVKKALNIFDVNIKILILEKTAKTAKDASIALDCETGAIVKSLLLKAESKFILCLIPGDKKCSLNKLKKAISLKDVCMADAEQVKENTGFSIGGVSPVGHLNLLEILIDKSFDRFVNVFAAAGHPNSIFKISSTNLIKITNGKVMDISE
tara:strand:- start:1899 stop:2381 length:483 start_codon:yes stop_codon:yes gene_type:complete